MNTNTFYSLDLDSVVFAALGLPEPTEAETEIVESWDEDDKLKAVIFQIEYGTFKLGDTDPQIDGDEITIYEAESMEAHAQNMVDDGGFGEIPEHLQNYIDYAKIAKDMEMEGYSSAGIAGTNYIYRLG